jgi:hypothetical protein
MAFGTRQLILRREIRQTTGSKIAKFSLKCVTWVNFLRERIHLPAAQPKEVVVGLLKQLDSPQFAEREKAEKALTGKVELFTTELAEATKGNVSAEVRERLDNVLKSLETITPERLRHIRACEVLEGIAVPDAVKVLRAWSAGPKRSRLTVEANESLERIGTR